MACIERRWFVCCFTLGMRLQSKPDALETSENKPETPVTPPVTVNRDPSYPDRARIDSDVRAFLRPASSPWIVFDRDSRVDDFAKSALRIGAVFASSPSLIEPTNGDVEAAIAATTAEQAEAMKSLAPLHTPIPTPVIHNAPADPSPFALAPTVPMATLDPIREGAVLTSGMNSSAASEMGMFPTSTGGTEPPVSEPSNLVVASDVMTDSSENLPEPYAQVDADQHGHRPLTESDPFSMGLAPSFFARKGRVLAIAAGACTSMVALILLTSVAFSSTSRAHVKNASATHAMEAPVAAAAAAQPAAAPAIAPAAAVDTATIELDAPPAAAAPSVAPEQHAGPVEPTTKMPLDPKKRFGKLTIKADAKGKTVWFDGKRMLGTGQRSFMVFCGMHTVAVADKTETKDIEIPCNGEYTVSK